MSDVVTKYKGWEIARNIIGFRVLNILYSPIFKTHAEAKKFIRFLNRGLH